MNRAGPVLILLLAAPPAIAGDADCKAVLDAVVKQAGMPVHQRMEIESSQSRGRKMQSEIVRTADSLYMQINGQWQKRPYDPAKTVAEAQEAMRKSAHTCTLVRRDSVNGQAADLYKVHSEGAQGTSDAEVWLSVADGLPLRQHTQMTPPGGAPMRHDVTYDYANVKAPVP